MTRYYYRGPNMLMEFETEPGSAERIERHLVQGSHVELPETDPVVKGWFDRGVLAPPLASDDADDLPPPPPTGDGEPPPPDAHPNPAARTRRPKHKE